MLALRPDLVRSGGVDMTAQVEGFEQADLNTFGFGYNAPEGAYGSPSLASREKGERIVESIKRNMLRHVRQRLEWLEKNRTYSGKGLDER
jgi:creatinine amidohydrolase/Fe(II)-dependent formamide hydrolase-like protein